MLFSEEHQLDSNPTQRSLCKAKNKVENVTLVDGIGAGNFTDLGHVPDMSDCVSRCCSVSTCELAFRIEDDCYGVTCYSEHSCRTRSARNSMSLRPMIAFVRDIGSRQGNWLYAFDMIIQKFNMHVNYIDNSRKTKQFGRISSNSFKFLS